VNVPLPNGLPKFSPGSEARAHAPVFCGVGSIQDASRLADAFIAMRVSWPAGSPAESTCGVPVQSSC